jgi:glycosyltransferase involved in cell wall biosynthesis
MAVCRIIYIGRLDSDTGITTYLKALQLIKLKVRDVSIEFLGDGKLRRECEEYGKVHGFVKDPNRYMKDARFIFSSGYLSMLEALSMKKLTFATYDNPVKRSYLVDSPFSKYAVIEKDPALIAKKLISFWKNPKLEIELTSNGYNWATKQTWQSVTQVYLNLWSLA